jgi:2-oxoisovalerate dehydrogenase E2 component (dihydrolipoyl transacylase)
VSRYSFKLPDLGEGTVEAEIVGWKVKPGDVVNEEDVIVEVMTDKAAVEVPAPVSGRVVSTTGTPGDMVPVGAELIVFETEVGEGTSTPAPTPEPVSAPKVAAAQDASAPAKPTEVSRDATHAQTAPAAVRSNGAGADADADARTGTVAPAASASTHAAAPSGANGHASHAPATRAPVTRVATSPAIRRRAHEAGIDLTQLSGTGPNGRILREDFEAFVTSRSGPRLVRSKPGQAPASVNDGPPIEEIKVIGLRRLIAQRMSDAKRNIPHFAYVEELDVTELESLRKHLNSKVSAGAPSLTYLPFLVAALVRVLRDFPQCNAQYDAERGVIIRHRAVHVGVATQTPDGLKVPVVRDAQSLSLWDLASQMRRVTEAARTNKATRDELSGSTITVTSLGKLGGIASTPIINAPEVSIIGVNRAVERPVVYQGAIGIRRMMNLSSSFDHRFVDGHDAAAMIQALKERLEHPATIFID